MVPAGEPVAGGFAWVTLDAFGDQSARSTVAAAVVFTVIRPFFGTNTGYRSRGSSKTASRAVSVADGFAREVSTGIPL